MPAVGMHAARGTQLPRDIIKEWTGPQMSADTMRRSAKRALLVLAACIAAAPAFAQRGAMTVPRNLDQLTDRASDIVRGTVVSARVEKHPELSNLDTVVVTLRVHDTLKGARQRERSRSASTSGTCATAMTPRATARARISSCS